MNENTKARLENIIEDLTYYLTQFENVEKNAKEANMSVDEVITNTKKSFLEFAEKW